MKPIVHLNNHKCLRDYRVFAILVGNDVLPIFDEVNIIIYINN